MAAKAARCANAASRDSHHPILTRPALLSHIFKFVVAEHKDVRLLYVNTAWEDTAINFCPWMWQRLAMWLARAHGVKNAPPAKPVSIEQHSQACFNHFVWRVWARQCPRTTLKAGNSVCLDVPPSLFARLVNPLALQLRGPRWITGWITPAALEQIGKQTTLVKLTLSYFYFKFDSIAMSHICNLVALQRLDLSCCALLTDAAVAHLPKLVLLTALNVSRCRSLTAVSMAHIGAMPALQELDVSCNPVMVTDAGVPHLHGMSPLVTDANLPALRKLNVSHSSRTDAQGTLSRVVLLLHGSGLLADHRAAGVDPSGRAVLRIRSSLRNTSVCCGASRMHGAVLWP